MSSALRCSWRLLPPASKRLEGACSLARGSQARGPAVVARGIRFDTGDEATDFINRSLAPNQGQTQTDLRTTRQEALALYRAVLRASRAFTWTDDKGNVWRDLLRESARKEFEAARFESDPELVIKLIVGGRDALEKVTDRFSKKYKELAEERLPDRGPG
mmetsp:Transcript_1063/g.3736  ORF Transcript_1063/g.3736 Transcript_1063/m.3736 type:complete len:160 (-) Transcript_1063:1534-2013(-)